MAIKELSNCYTLVTYKEAKAAGLTRYFTGKVCKYGHIDQRMISNKTCCICLERKANVRRSKPDNRKRRLERRRKRRKENLQEIRAKGRKRYAEKASELAARMREYRRQHPDRIKAAKQKTYKKTYAKILARNHTRRARIRNAEGFFTAADLARIRKQQRDRCGACRKPLHGGGHADHINALVNGGSNWPSNIQLLCAPCNGKKRAKDPIVFMQEMGYLL